MSIYERIHDIHQQYPKSLNMWNESTASSTYLIRKTRNNSDLYAREKKEDKFLKILLIPDLNLKNIYTRQNIYIYIYQKVKNQNFQET